MFNPYLPEEQYANYRRARRLLESVLGDLTGDQAASVQRHLDQHCKQCGKPLTDHELFDHGGYCLKHSYEAKYKLVFALYYDAELEVITC